MGNLQPGDQLPSDRDLATLVGHSVETAAKAKRLLVEHGLAATGRGLGTLSQTRPSRQGFRWCR